MANPQLCFRIIILSWSIVSAKSILHRTPSNDDKTTADLAKSTFVSDSKRPQDDHQISLSQAKENSDKPGRKTLPPDENTSTSTVASGNEPENGSDRQKSKRQERQAKRAVTRKGHSVAPGKAKKTKGHPRKTKPAPPPAADDDEAPAPKSRPDDPSSGGGGDGGGGDGGAGLQLAGGILGMIGSFFGR